MSIRLEFSHILQDEVFEHADELTAVDKVTFARKDLLSDLERYQRFPRQQKPGYLSASIHNVRQSMHNAFAILLGEDHMPEEQQLERCAGLVVGENREWTISLQEIQPHNNFVAEQPQLIHKLAEAAIQSYLHSSLEKPHVFFSRQNDRLLQPHIESFVMAAQCTPRGRVLHAAEITATLASNGVVKGVATAANATLGQVTRRRPH